MNRIILIGNGFDLAHGLKTSYQNFMDWFWGEQVKEANVFGEWRGENGNFVFENDFFKLKKDLEKNDKKEYTKYEDNDVATLKQNVSYYKNSFLERIEKARIIRNWVDLEELYYRELLICLRIEKANNDAFVVSPIKKLNEDFESIRKKFESYLSKEVIKEIKDDKKIPEIEKHIWKDYNGSDKVLFLNFNYTNTENLYINEIGKKRNYEVIHIHGEVNSKDYPMIFGYGDELAVDFKDIENTNRNEFLENAKSIKYLETDSYDRLLKFINQKNFKYEVFIFGHSCGNSDRTLLNTIFEHKNCAKIRPFYHQESVAKDNFSEMTRNISRSFTKESDSKSHLRELVEKKKNCSPLYYESKVKKELDVFKKENFVEINGNGIEYFLIDKSDKKQNINKFLIGKHQVVQALYIQIMGCRNPSYFKGINLPVEQVTWFDCAEFCNKLSEKYKLTKYYNFREVEEKDKDGGVKKELVVSENETSNGFRLPKECEWEYTARYWSRKDKKECPVYAGYTGTDENKEELKKYAWFYDNTDNNSTYEVGTANGKDELAIHDMSGNVWEWCNDTYEKSAYRVLRGGSWHNRAEGCAVSYRIYDSPDYRDNNFGFRLVLPQ